MLRETEETVQALSKDKHGNVLRTYGNVLAVLAAGTEERLRWNAFSKQAELVTDGRVTVLDDSDLRRIRRDFEKALGVDFGPQLIHEAALGAAELRTVHPVRDYLEGLEWDGVERVDRLFGDYFRCVDDQGLNAVFSRRFLVGAVARVMRPGCKLDTMLICKGPQGALKSTAFRALCGDAWFSDQTIADLKHANASQAIEGVWFFEFGELESMRKAEATAIKAWLSRSEEHYRAPYARTKTISPRQCICVGTTNEASFLTDSTGNRRFWVREVAEGKRCDVEAIARDRSQLWAEALESFEQGCEWWLTPEEDAARGKGAEHYRSLDPWEELLAGENLEGKTTVDALIDILKIEAGRQTPYDQKRVANVLQGLGYAKKRRQIGGTRRVTWTRGVK